MNTMEDFGDAHGDVKGFTDGKAFQEREGPVARAIEKTTARVPSDTYLWMAGAAMIGSLAFQILSKPPTRGLFGGRGNGRAPIASFIGQWVPTLLLLGVYNKIVKVAGSDRVSR